MERIVNWTIATSILALTLAVAPPKAHAAVEIFLPLDGNKAESSSCSQLPVIINGFLTVIAFI